MSLTTNPNDPRLGHGPDEKPVPQNDVYLVLSAEEIAKGYLKPLRESYRHVGPPGPTHPLRDLTDDERERYGDVGYVKYEPYPPGNSGAIGRFWTQAQLDGVRKGCGSVTTMAHGIAATYAREPSFYGSTYCCACSKHLPLKEFVWIGGGGESMDPNLWPAQEKARVAALRGK